MPTKVEVHCRKYVESLPLRPKELEKTLRTVRGDVGKILKNGSSNRGDGLMNLTSWAAAREAAIMTVAIALPAAEADKYTPALDALEELSASVAAEITGADGVTNFVPETKAGALSVAEEKMVQQLKIPAKEADKLRQKMLAVKLGNAGNFRQRLAGGQTHLRAVALGDIRIVFDPKTNTIVDVGRRKEVYQGTNTRH